jgi:enediyne biosynthesis thioesterase
MFLREKAPGVLEDLARGLVLVTTRCSCEYLAELNAFDEVRIDMRLEALTTDRIKLAFEYWRCKDSKEELAAIGGQEIACMKRNDTGLVPSVLPEQLETALRSYTAF